jgi:hypothetical protein
MRAKELEKEAKITLKPFSLSLSFHIPMLII